MSFGVSLRSFIPWFLRVLTSRSLRREILKEKISPAKQPLETRIRNVLVAVDVTGMWNWPFEMTNKAAVREDRCGIGPFRMTQQMQFRRKPKYPLGL